MIYKTQLVSVRSTKHNWCQYDLRNTTGVSMIYETQNAASTPLSFCQVRGLNPITMATASDIGHIATARRMGTGFKFISVYIAQLLSVYTPSRHLRSSSDTRTFRIPFVKTKSFGQRAFSFTGPTQRNLLPYGLRHSQSSPAFKTKQNPSLQICVLIFGAC